MAPNLYLFAKLKTFCFLNFFFLFKDIFQNPDVKFHTDTIYIDRDEASIASIITDVANRYKEDDVVIGSYPNLTNRFEHLSSGYAIDWIKIYWIGQIALSTFPERGSNWSK